jgi:hydroxyethylthiazole kinase-like uncharacterized protein yjeF
MNRPAAPQLIAPSGDRSLPLHGMRASRAIELAAQQTLPPFTLMRRAGLAAARCALAIAPHARCVWVAAGPGNNGGDGLRAALELHRVGKAVTVSLLADPARLPPDAADALAAARQAGVPLIATPQPPGPCDIAIDALLGIGASRPPAGGLAQAAQTLNALAAPVLALDLPSGLDAERGQPLGPVSVRATHTLSLLTLKPGLFTGSGRELAGQVWFDDLQITPAEPPDAWLAGGEACSHWQQPRPNDRHKGSFGDVVVVGGAPGMTGAAWLAARAALRAGAGRVYVDLLDTSTAAAPWPELMVRHRLTLDEPATLERATVVCGCGGGTAIEQTLPVVLQRAARLVLDADALNLIAARPALQALLDARHAPTVLTPHPLEAARLLACGAAEVQHDRLRAAQSLAERRRCVVVLKGSGSICAVPEGLASINPTGNALLSTAGTGDVLAGWTAGWWAAAGGEATLAAAQRVAMAAAWWHGHIADLSAGAGQRLPLVAAALIDAMAAPGPLRPRAAGSL